ncbi:MAG: redoxin domain-containing protein [Blastocatellia bacterium]
MNTLIVDATRGDPRRLHLLAIGLTIMFLVSLQPAGAGTMANSAQAKRDDPAYEEEVGKARDFLRRRQYEEALKGFKRANEMVGKRSPECLLGMAQAYQGLEAYKNVVESCDKVIELVDIESGLRAHAHNFKGIALQSQAANKDQKKLREAEAAFREGLALDAAMPVLHYNLGFTLMQQGRDPEGISELKTYLELQPKGINSAEAAKLIENPRRARETYAPEFSVTTSEGEYLALEDLRGKVVLLDFWGTWCPPCVASVPSLRSLHKRFEKEPAFVMIGISSDSEGEKWRAFIAENKMVWRQHWDRDHRVQRAFNVRAFPTYILIDGEGIVRFRSIGSSWERTGTLDDAIRKHVKMAAKTASTS